MSFEPTSQQIKIINETSSTVVIAKPGSGKTFVLSQKVKNILPGLLEYQGVIAISYTNKASNELKHRCLSNNLSEKGSFFGTIDKFYISEFIMPFGKYIFGIPNVPLTVISITDLPEAERQEFSWLTTKDFNYDQLKADQLGSLSSVFRRGQILLQAVGILSLHIFDRSLACRKYLKARYTHVIIDEYQDSGSEQHELFLKLQELGLTAIAVGDADQSIYGFSHKDSRYLLSLAKNRAFKLFPLSLNHRSHPSIVNYSSQLLTETFQPIDSDEFRVFEKHVVGTEEEIANWIDIAIPYFLDKYQISKFKEIGILTRASRTAKIVAQNLKHNHKLFINTPLDEDSNIWARIFTRLLEYLNNPADTKMEFLEEFLDVESNPAKSRELFAIMENLSVLFVDLTSNIALVTASFVKIASVISREGKNKKSVKLLKTVLQSSDHLNSYKPAKDSEVQIMTIHKSKGLEFDLVFHLDLYEWILPAKGINEDDRSTTYYPTYEQDLNLHYVGITRARKCCVLCTSTLRHNKTTVKNGKPSELLFINGLSNNRLPSPC